MPVVLLFATAMTGCAAIPADAELYGENNVAVELTNTPFYPQERYQCGPAALLTLLEQSGVQTSMDVLVDQVYVPRMRGSVQIELLAATRAAGRIPYLTEPTMQALMAELEAERPVLVLQNLGVSWLPKWHYAVLVGVDPESGVVTLRSGTEPRRKTPTRTFVRTWQRGGNWAFVALRPGDLPAVVDKLRYFESVSAMEQTGHFIAARQGWSAALQRWPRERVALFGMANASYATEDYVQAEHYYRRLLEIDPDLHVARNNLALALSGLGKTREALRQIQLVLDKTDTDDQLGHEYRATKSEIIALSSMQADMID